MTRLRLATSDTFRSLKIRNFRLFFIGPAGLAGGQLAHPHRPDAPACSS